ncbi:adenylate kinase [Candidatus Woesearchaeota archaeon B3_Woes]|nr:MAG: adenylate kinase [Candidatus Woesearchaeota archaeon B3_Woes]
MNIVFLGPPSVGKGTYTSRIKEKYRILHISTGDIFRENIKNNTNLGQEAKKYMDQGKLVPDEVTINMVKDRLSKDDVKKGYILDGFPRTTPQAEALSEFSKIDVVINFTADESVIIQRVGGRIICKKCSAIFNINNIPPKVENVCDKCGGELYQRDDDKPEAVKKRLKIYEEQTAPLIKYYKEKGLLKTIDANTEDIDSIVQKVIKILDPIQEKSAL